MSDRLKMTDKFAAKVAAEFLAGTSLPEAIRKLGDENIHLVSPLYWKLDGESRPFAAKDIDSKRKLNSAVRAARKAGDRREVVAARAGISTAEVKRIEGKRPVYTGKGTKKHLA